MIFEGFVIFSGKSRARQINPKTQENGHEELTTAWKQVFLGHTENQEVESQ
jgi:hypothetical protein